MSSRVYTLISTRSWDECKRVIPLATAEEINYRGADQWSALLQACEKEAPSQIVRLLLDGGADVNVSTKDHWTPLLYACEKQAPLEVISMLLEKGADTNARTKDHWTPLLYACEKQASPAIVRLLLEKGADPNVATKNQWTALLYTCDKRAPAEVIQALVGSGADVNVVTRDQWTPLLYACDRVAPVEVIRAIVASDADVNAVTKDQWTPLLYACEKQAPIEVVRVLVENGANVNAATKDQWTPLLYVLEKQSPPTVAQLLVEAGANVNVLTKDHWSPLLYACDKKAPIEILELLLTKGADPSQKNKSGQGPLDRETRPEAQALLKRSMVSFTSFKGSYSGASSSRSRDRSADSSMPFFSELFTKAEITDLGKQRDYASRLHKESINTPGVLSGCTKDELKKFGIAFGDAIRLLEACKRMQNLQVESTTGWGGGSTRQFTQASLDTTKVTVMISYQWDSKSIALQVKDHLLALNRFNVIMDMTGIHGNFLEWMEESLQASDALIMLITPQYQASTNCRAEACRAHELKKKMVPLVLDKEYTGAGWLAPVIAGFMRYDGSTPDALMENLDIIVARELSTFIRS